ncbi:MAG TPA: ATP-binding protein [Pyrinomonadaceae bacterium]|nr:ATP-binding protein [Pyrinomonadaceae bacterium]
MFYRKPFLGYIAAVVVIAAATGALRALGSHVNPTTVALTFVLIILVLATAWGSRAAVLASLLGAACFNFFFLTPLGTFHIADPENWIALAALLITAITVGQLSSRAKSRADEATAARHEIERLYQELQKTFEETSQAKALKQSERLKSALLDAVTHDLRTPLTSIKASVTTLLDDQRALGEADLKFRLNEEERVDMLEVIDEEADRLDRFIEDLVAMARIEAGELQLRREWGSLEDIVAAALERASPLARNHHIELRIPDDLPSIRVDERAVAEVIFVLLENAAKYSPSGSTIRLAAVRAAEDMVRLTIEDEGPGIPAELRERVFDKFFRAMRNGDSVGHKPGTGMGLAIARGIVEAHGGRIWIEDAEGSGTRMVILLPTRDIQTTRKEIPSTG